MTDFKRARRTDQKNARRQSLLDAAADLFDAGGPSGAGINAIAAHAGFTKSNVYRYFESREHVLLSLFLEEFEGFSLAVSERIGSLPAGDVGGIADAMTAGFLDRPRLCKLVAIFGTVLEQNVSADTIEAVKSVLGGLTVPLVEAMRQRLPGATTEDCQWAFAMTTSLLAGMWPGVCPSPAAAEVLAKPEFARMTLALDREFKRALEALLRSVVGTPHARADRGAD